MNTSVKKDNLEKHYIRKIIIVAVILRIIVVGIEYALKAKIPPYFSYDDEAYVRNAKLYASIASRLIDITALRKASWAFRWYGLQTYPVFVGIIYYFAKSEVILRLCNVLFSVCTVYNVYHIARNIFGESTARYAGLFYAILPYHVIYATATYKDLMLTMLFTYVFWNITKYFNNEKCRFYHIALSIVSLFIMEYLRFGCAEFLLILLAIIFFWKKVVSSKRNAYIVAVIGGGAILIIGMYFLILYLPTVQSKFLSYMDYSVQNSDGGFLSIFKIHEASDWYLIFPAYLIMLAMPGANSIQIENWNDILAIANISIFPVVALVVMFYVTPKKQSYWIIHLPILAFQLFCVMTVLGTARHYYFLQFWNVIISAYVISKIKDRKWLKDIFVFWIIISVVVVLLAIYYSLE